jgi:hypothetical protein
MSNIDEELNDEINKDGAPDFNFVNNNKEFQQESKEKNFLKPEHSSKVLLILLIVIPVLLVLFFGVWMIVCLIILPWQMKIQRVKERIGEPFILTDFYLDFIIGPFIFLKYKNIFDNI